MSEAAPLEPRPLMHRGVAVPAFLYGTAWKEAETEALTLAALEAGFRGIDTANQRRHYYEAGVGRAAQRFIASGAARREDLFLQTKYTYAAGQDHRLPYDPQADYASQVRQSFAKSLEHLKTDYIDAYILHGPLVRQGLSGADWEVWRAMEELHRGGAAKTIGVSNVALDQLLSLLKKAEIAPAFVQNRCYASMRWDAEIRACCRDNGVLYQGFSLLTANAAELNRAKIFEIARAHEATVAQIVFRFCLQEGMLPLTGTTSREHMMEDLAASRLGLSGAEMDVIANIGA